MLRKRFLNSITARYFAFVLCVAQLMYFSQPILEASDRRLEGSVLEIHQRTSQFVDPANKKTASLTEKPVYILRKGDTVTLVLVDGNPLLFTYGVDVTESETEQHKIAAQFAKSLSDVLQPFRSLTAGGPGVALTVEGLDLKEFQSDLNKLSDDIAAIPDKIAQSVGSDADIAQLKTAVSDWQVEGLADRLAKAFPKLAVIAAKCLGGRSLATSSGTDVSCLDPLDPSAEAQAKLRAAANQPPPASVPALAPAPPVVLTPAPVPVPRQPGGGPARPGAAPLGGQPQPRNSRQPAAQSSQPPAPGIAPAPVTVAAAPAKAFTQTIQDFITLAMSMETKAESSIQVLTGFAADVAGVGAPVNLKCKDQASCNYSINDQAVTLKIGKSSKYDAFLTTATKAKQQSGSGDYSFTLTPYTPATIGVAPAFVLLFMRNPTFKAAKKGDQYVIQSDDSQATGYNVAAMLTITPKGWAEPTFGGQFQIGVSPTKDRIGFYLGAGIHVQEMFTFGGGFAWQQVNRLASGLIVGQTIASSDDLKTDTEYKPGFYFHITVSVPK